MIEEMRNSRKLFEEFIIPSCSAKAFHLKKGQILRVTAHEGRQVADIIFFNAGDHKEQMAAWWSTCLNSERPKAEIIGGTKRVKELYSKPPWERIMLRVIDDKVGDHSFHGSCSPKVVDLCPDHYQDSRKTCVELFADCLEPYGLSQEDFDSSGTMSIFMPTRFKDDENGTLDFPPGSCEKGDYIEFLAEMDLLVAATSCPQTSPINDCKPKAMKYEIFGNE
jgi:uncharacterized protein YcgI (DUF1989 family)